MKERTIYDIARQAGVSATTVSRVVNGSARVSRETKARVQKVIEACHYVPNAAARSLVTQSSRLIGILISDIRTMHHAAGVYYIERELAHQGYCCLILNTGEDAEEQTQYIRMLNERNVEAAVLMGSIYQTETIRRAIAAYLPETPVVLCNGYLNLPNVYGLIADEQVGVMKCVELLAAKGRRHLAFVLDRETPSNALKQQGYESGVLRSLGEGSPVVVRTDGTRAGARKATEALMAQYPETDGIIYADDVLAMVGIGALTGLGIRIPERVAVVGINNSLYAENSNPSLTSLDNMLQDLSLTAARNLQAVLRGEHVSRRMLICSEIVEREST